MKSDARNQAVPSKSQRLKAAASALALVLVASVGHAGTSDYTFPTDPLQTGTSTVPPNILFILDDSGSMAFESMPNDPSGSNYALTDSVTDRSYANNTIYYNPAKTYTPWVKADGSQMTGGTSYNTVYGSFNLASGTTINLASSSSCAYYNQNDGYTTDSNSSYTKVCGGDQTFYVPKDTTQTGSTYLSTTSNFYRYQILTTSQVQRSEQGSVTGTTINIDGNTTDTGSLSDSTAVNNTSATVGVGYWVKFTIKNTTSGNSTAGLTYVVYDPANTSVCSGSVARGSSTTCSTPVTSTAGTYKVTVSRANSVSTGYSLSAIAYNSCNASSTSGTSWINCTYTTPTGRTVAAEMTNYATWFSYYRTRNKVAKAGASKAFATEITKGMRVGFRTIWGSDHDITSSYSNWPTYAKPIPVGHNNGLFSDSVTSSDGTVTDEGTAGNRSLWYSRLQGVIAYNGTPLQASLQNAGKYFQQTDATGPYGDGTLSGSSQLACRANYAIMATDGYWNGTYDNAVGDADSKAGTQYTDKDGNKYGYTAVAPYTDSSQVGSSSYSNTLADVANYYWKTDLRSDLSDVVPTSTDDKAFWQHMVTFGVSIGQKGTVAETSVDEIIAHNGPTSNGTTRIAWPNPTDKEDSDRITDLLHASVNGHGAFVVASDADEFADALSSALSKVGSRLGSASNVLANSTRFSGDTRVYQATYYSGDWYGELNSYVVTTAGTSSTPEWKASGKLPVYTSRKIYTTDSAGTVDTFPTATQKTELTAAATSLAMSATNTQIANWVKGDQSNEAQNSGVLRTRTKATTDATTGLVSSGLLGDIVDSSPVYQSESAAIFVGANDGMLHAFDGTASSGGTELFAYVPHGVAMATLADLASPLYGSNSAYPHLYSVDGPVAVSRRLYTPNKNYLAAGLGRGGKGVFALDVTSPTSFSASSVLWDKTGDAAPAQMGDVMANISIVPLNNGQAGVIVANGLNSTAGDPVLYVLNVTNGNVIAAIDASSVDSAAAGSNGLVSMVPVDVDSDNKFDYVYAGDMKGNLWKFDLSGSSASSWKVTRLFKAINSDGKVQPITATSTVVENLADSSIWVLFGTGSLITNSDLTNTDVQTLYGVRDDMVDSADYDGDGNKTERIFTSSGGNYTRSALLGREIVGVSTTSADGETKTVRALETYQSSVGEDTNGNPLYQGWYIDLDLGVSPSNLAQYLGERVVSAGTLVDSTWEVNSVIPPGSGSSDCSSDGSGWETAIYPFSGTGTESGFFTDSSGNALTTTINGKTYQVDSVAVDGMPTTSTVVGTQLVTGTSDANLEARSVKRSTTVSRRMSWRELLLDQ